MTRLDAIKAREQAATKGPWKARRNDQRPYKHVEFDPNGYTTSPLEAADAVFLAHARTDIPWLLFQVEELRGTLIRLVDQWDQVSGAPHRTIDQARAALAAMEAPDA